MESAYGIGIKNRYELFYDDEEDPLDIIKQQEEEKKKKKETKQQQEKENKVKGPGPAPSKAKNIISVKKGPKESLPVKAQEPSVPRKDDNNRARSQKPQTDRVVKFSSNIREENKDLEERKNRRNREDTRPERSGPPEFRERGGGFDRNAQWDNGERNSGGGTNDRERNDLKENRNNDGENRRGRGGGFGGRGGFRGRGRGRGGAGGPGYDNRGKREFERQSGSDKRYNGIKAVDKREGGGSHNWGTIRDDMENLNNTTALSSDEAPEWAEKPEETTEVISEKEGEQTAVVATEGGESDKPLAEEGPKIMTLDEYKKEQEKKRAVPQFNIRKAGEGEDSTQWKKTYVLKKKDEEEDTEEMEEVTDDEEDIRRGRAKHVVDIEINYSDSRRGRGRGRGGRGIGPRGAASSAGLGREDGGGRGGGGRGSFNRGSDGAGGSSPGSSDNGVGALGGEGRGRGGSGGISREGGGGPRGGRGGRGGNKNQSAPKVDDENDFPSLVAA